MSEGIEFLVRLLEQGPPAHVAWEDFEGEHGDLLRACQSAGFLDQEPTLHPVPSCPHCGEGVPYRIGSRHLCNHCRTAVAPQHLDCWCLDVDAFLGWLSSRLQLRGRVRRIEECLWHLGAWGRGDELHECFYRSGGFLSEHGGTRLAAYRNVLVLHGLSRPPEATRLGVRCLSLLTVLRLEDTLSATDLPTLLSAGGRVRFDARSGALQVGDRKLGEVPAGSKEAFFLDCLARRPDQFVSYADLKRDVLLRTGSRDSRDEATFCHRLKSRIKRQFIPRIDRLIVTTNKGDGYRLRGHVEVDAHRPSVGGSSAQATGV